MHISDGITRGKYYLWWKVYHIPQATYKETQFLNSELILHSLQHLLQFKLLAAAEAHSILLIDYVDDRYEPRCEKTGLRGFRPGPTQTGLYSHRRCIES